MKTSMFNRRSTFITLTAAAALTFGALTSARAGECPADQRRLNGTGQPMSANPASGVTDVVITATELAKEPVSIQGRLFRARKLDIAPGGVVPWHSHGDRPALLLIASGEITEYASTCAVPIQHKAGDITPERKPHVALVEEHRRQAGGDLCVRLVSLGREARRTHDVRLGVRRTRDGGVVVARPHVDDIDGT